METYAAQEEQAVPADPGHAPVEPVSHEQGCWIIFLLVLILLKRVK